MVFLVTDLYSSETDVLLEAEGLHLGLNPKAEGLEELHLLENKLDMDGLVKMDGETATQTHTSTNTYTYTHSHAHTQIHTHSHTHTQTPRL